MLILCFFEGNTSQGVVQFKYFTMNIWTINIFIWYQISTLTLWQVDCIWLTLLSIPNIEIMLSNWLCFTAAILEVFLFAGVAFGYGFLQYIFEKEQVFWDDVCYDPKRHPNCTKPNGKLFSTFETWVGHGIHSGLSGILSNPFFA